jgi:hypothetical protein
MTRELIEPPKGDKRYIQSPALCFNRASTGNLKAIKCVRHLSDE